MWRLVKWLFLICVLLLLIVFVGGPFLLSSEPGRKSIEGMLGSALGRDVTLGRLDIGLFYQSLKLDDLEIGNAEGFPAGSFLRASDLKLDASLKEVMKKHLQGNVYGSGIDLLIQRKGGTTNLEGLGGTKKREGAGEVPDLDLSLQLTDSKVTIEDLDKNEKVVLDGVGLWMQLSNRADRRDTNLRIRIDSLERGGIHVRDLELKAKEAEGWLDLEQVEAHLAGQGKLSGNGRLQLRDGDAWQLRLDAQGVKLSEDVMPVVGSIFPLAAKAEGQADGQLNATFDVNGKGLTWEAIKPTLLGTGQVTLTNVELPAGSVLAMVSQFAGRPPGAVQINDAGAVFGVQQGWISFNRLSANTHEARYDLAGRVSLDGQLDLSMDLLPLAKLFGGGTYKDVAKRVNKIPIRIGGTSSAPKFALPKADDLLKGLAEKALEDELGSALEKLKKKSPSR
jgi:hypothetical protein